MRTGAVLALLLSGLVLAACGDGAAATPSHPPQATPTRAAPATPPTASALMAASTVAPGLAATGASAAPATPSAVAASTTPLPTPLPVASLLATPVAVAFVSADHGWLIAGRCLALGVPDCGIFVTGDGGKTWRLQVRTNFELDSLEFQGPRDGWATGRDCHGPPGRQTCQGVLLATSDGGAAWAVRRVGATLAQLQFVDARRGWALASRCSADDVASCQRELWQTTDGGATWQTLAPPLREPDSLRMVDAADGWLAGCADAEDARTGACPRPVVLATHDGGKSWRTQLTLPATSGSFGAALASYGRSDLWLLASDTGACSMGGCWGPLYHTTDGGQHWSQEQPLYHWHMVGDAPDRPGFPGAPTFASPLVGWIPAIQGAGPGVGGLATTQDGGKTWARVGAQEGWNVAEVAAISPSTLWIVGARRAFPSEDQPFLFQSTDGGRTWRQRLPASPLLPTAPPPFATPTPPASASPTGVTIELIGQGTRHVSIAPGQVGRLPVGNGEIDILVHYPHPVVAGGDGDRAPFPVHVAVSPYGWTPVLGDFGRPDTLTLHLFGSAPGQFTVTISGTPANPPITFRLAIAPNSVR